MMTVLRLALGAMALMVLAGAILARRSHPARTTVKAFLGGVVGLNGLIALAALTLVGLALANPMPALAQTATTAATKTLEGAATGAGLATGLACIGAGIAVGIAGAAAIGGITEKPEILGRTLIFVGLGEGIAIYGLIISFLILNG